MSLPDKAYVGSYVNEHFGTIRVKQADSSLTMSIGRLGLSLDSDGGRLYAVEDDRDAHSLSFVEKDGTVAALSIRLYGQLQRFERVD